MENQNRRLFLRSATALAAAPFAGSVFPKIANASSTLADPLPASAVQEFVKVAHSDFDRCKEILKEYPHILNAAWDWGDGDFETAIGAAGHMGHRELAIFLLDAGARTDIFVLTMLGETEIVRSMLEKYPRLLNSIGPHGFTLLHHAEKGGDNAAPLLEYFIEKKLTEKHVDYFKK